MLTLCVGLSDEEWHRVVAVGRKQLQTKALGAPGPAANFWRAGDIFCHPVAISRV